MAVSRLSSSEFEWHGPCIERVEQIFHAMRELRDTPQSYRSRGSLERVCRTANFLDQFSIAMVVFQLSQGRIDSIDMVVCLLLKHLPQFGRYLVLAKEVRRQRVGCVRFARIAAKQLPSDAGGHSLRRATRSLAVLLEIEPRRHP